MAFAKGSYIICAGCNTQLDILSDYSAIRICDTCGLVNQKYKDADPLTVSKIPEDLSVIKTGSKGKANGSSFVVTGRFRIEIDSGYYNVWSIALGKTDELAWIIDSIGEYIVAYSKRYEATAVKEISMWTAEVERNFSLPELGSCMLVVAKKLIAGYMEGEIGTMPLVMNDARVYDLRTTEGDIVFIIRTRDKELFYLQGRSIDWEEMELTGTRNIEIIGKG